MCAHASFAVLFALCFAAGLVALAGEDPGAAARGPAWRPGKAIDLKGLKVHLSDPVLVWRSKSFLWFPTLVRLGNGELLAIMSPCADTHFSASVSAVSRSTDGGLTWGEPRIVVDGGSVGVPLPSGDVILLPYLMRPRPGGMGAPYNLAHASKRESLTHVRTGATVTGWPRPDRSFAPDLGVSGFVFNGQVVALKDGKHLTTLYGYFKGDKQYSLVAAESANGVQWTIRSVVADHKCGLPMAQNEGPCEAALCRLADGRLMCIFRLGSGLPYGQVWSGDEAKTWTKPVAMTGVYSVEPSLVVLNDGTVALSGGRPGLALWFNTDGTGKGWHEPLAPLERWRDRLWAQPEGL